MEKKNKRTNSFPCGAFTPVKGKETKKLKKGTDGDQYIDENKSDILASLTKSMGIITEFNRQNIRTHIRGLNQNVQYEKKPGHFICTLRFKKHNAWEWLGTPKSSKKKPSYGRDIYLDTWMPKGVSPENDPGKHPQLEDLWQNPQVNMEISFTFLREKT